VRRYEQVVGGEQLGDQVHRRTCRKKSRRRRCRPPALPGPRRARRASDCRSACKSYVRFSPNDSKANVEVR
jgi:hypothetical protein